MTTSERSSFVVRVEPRAGDLGLVTRHHGLLYAEEYGFDWRFEAYVAATLAEFAENYRPERDRLWIAERDGSFAGSVGVIGRDAGQAQLRWLLVHPGARGEGLGRRLIDDLIEFCRGAGYTGVYLWTVHVLDGAARLYRGAGFVKTETKPAVPLWGATLAEERYEMTIEAGE